MSFLLGDLAHGAVAAATRSTRRSQCSRKAVYLTVSAAETARQNLSAARSVPLELLRVYACPHAHDGIEHFHIGKIVPPDPAVAVRRAARKLAYSAKAGEIRRERAVDQS